MTTEMVFNIFLDGTIQHTLKDDVLRIEGHRSVERASDIRWDDEWQRFYIIWLLGPYAGKKQTTNLNAEIFPGSYSGFGREEGQSARGNADEYVCVFDTYDLAVQWEIKCLNQMRLNGEVF